MATKKETVMDADDEVVKPISFEWEGSTYVMEFNRSSLAFLEDTLGVNVMDTLKGKIVLSDMPKWFYASMRMHHPGMKVNVIDGIFEKISNKQELYMELIKLANEAVNTMYEEPEEGKAISWGRR